MTRSRSELATAFVRFIKAVTLARHFCLGPI
jgi:hypothetical protein